MSEGREDERASVSSPLTTEWLKRNKMFPVDGRAPGFHDGGKQLLSQDAAMWSISIPLTPTAHELQRYKLMEIFLTQT